VELVRAVLENASLECELVLVPEVSKEIAELKQAEEALRKSLRGGIARRARRLQPDGRGIMGPAFLQVSMSAKPSRWVSNWSIRSASSSTDA